MMLISTISTIIIIGKSMKKCRKIDGKSQWHPLGGE